MGLLITLVLWFAFYLGHVSAWWSIILFFPATLSALGFIQTYTHFCVGFGMAGLFNMDKDAGKADTISQAEFRKLDKAKAQKILLYSVLVGVIVALAAAAVLR